MSNHRQYYINVGQVLGIVGGLIVANRALRLEETKAGIEHRPIKEIIANDVLKVRKWFEDTFLYRQYTHH